MVYADENDGILRRQERDSRSVNTDRVYLHVISRFV